MSEREWIRSENGIDDEQNQLVYTLRAVPFYAGVYAKSNKVL